MGQGYTPGMGEDHNTLFFDEDIDVYEKRLLKKRSGSLNQLRNGQLELEGQQKMVQLEKQTIQKLNSPRVAPKRPSRLLSMNPRMVQKPINLRQKNDPEQFKQTAKNIDLVF